MKQRTDSELFNLVRSLNLPTADYILLGSAPLFAHGLIPAMTNDVDIVARNAAWEAACRLAPPVRATKGDSVVRLFGGSVEIFDGWFGMPWNMNELFSSAEIIEGLPFAPLPYVLAFKRVLNRPKDHEHCRRIEEYLHAKAMF
jgi:hypothetical protein